ncbi:MAG TPA: hypothetical protein DCM86_04110 [Verrucomicrobiales bacterium]|nr:hypothetical protein [Verrucomicrobiales bacterium]
MKWGAIFGCAAAAALSPATARASLTLTDWNNTGFDLSYGSWIPLNTCLTTTPGYAEISGAATSNGGAGFDVIQLDLTGYTDMVLDARAVAGNQAPTLNVVFWDLDGTEARYTFSTGLLNTSTFTSLQASFASFSLDIAGSTPGLDLAHITEWDVEGNQVGTEQFSIQFDQAYVVPEPGVRPMLGIGAALGILMLLPRGGTPCRPVPVRVERSPAARR